MTYNARIKTLLLIFFVIICTSVYSQEEKHDHIHHIYEIGVANSVVYFFVEKELAYGLHFHVVRNVKNTKFGYGFAYERIFDEHKHNTIGVVGSYNPMKSWNMNVSPGISFEDSEPSVLKFALHLETSYNFEVGRFHIGPLVEFAIDPDDYHFSLGLHIGLGF
jgi:hypothetical protein